MNLIYIQKKICRCSETKKYYDYYLDEYFSEELQW